MKKTKKFLKITVLSFLILAIVVAIITFVTEKQEQEVTTISTMAGNIENKTADTSAGGGLRYTTLDYGKKYAQVESVGDNGETISISATVPIAGETYTVTKIKDNAFENCKQLKNIEIPDTITEIGNNAFKGCSNLEGFNLPETVATIGEYAFADCTQLEGIRYGSSNHLITVGKYAFQNCTSLREAILPDTVTEIKEGTYEGCTSLVEISQTSVAEGITEIGNNAFKGCSNLEGFNLPETVATIGEYAFADCTQLEGIRYGSSNHLITVGKYAFQNCTSLREAILPDTVTEIKEGTYEGCTSLVEISQTSVAEGITEIGNNAFKGCSNLEGFNLLKTVTTIGEYAFANCIKLEGIGYGSSNHLTTVGKYAFQNCTSLTDVILTDLVTEIKEGTYKGCTSLKEINLPKTVTTIGDYAFADCNSLEQIIVSKDTKIATNALPNNSGLIVGRRDDTTKIVYQINSEDGTVSIIEKPEGIEEIPETIELDGKQYNVVSKPFIRINMPDSKDWTKDDILVEISVTDIVEITSLKMNQKDLTITEGKSQILIKSNGTYKVVATNKEGKSTTKQITITNIDKIAPIIEKVSNNQVYTKEVTPIIKDNEAGSGIDTIKLTKDEQEIAYTNGDKIQGKGKYKLEVTDKVGNTTSIEFEIVEGIEEVTEWLKIEGVEKEYTADNQVIKITITNKEGIKKVTINDKELENKSNVYTFIAEKKGSYVLRIYDVHDNILCQDTLEILIDKTAPTIKGVENNELYEEAVTPIIEDNESGVARIVLTKDGKEVDGYTRGQKIKENGKYTLTVYDKVGNSKTVTFEIKLKEEGKNENKGPNNNGNNNVGGKDTTTTKASSLPKAGISIAFIVTILTGMMISIFLYVKNKQYKDIK